MIVNPIIPIWIMLIFIPLFFLGKTKNKKRTARMILIVILVFCINLRIMFVTDNVKIVTNNLDVLFVFDTSISMVATDYKGKETRLSAVKEDSKYIVDELEGAKFSIIIFDDDSKILLPYTSNKDIIIESIEIMDVPNYNYASGTSLNPPINNILLQLKSSSKKTDRMRIIFMFSDGEITNDDDLKSYKELSDYVNNGAILGYGTTSGANMIVIDEYTGEKEYVEDRSKYPSKRAVSKINEENLNKIANDLNISYIHMSDKSNIDEKLSDIKSGISYNYSNMNTSAYIDIYYIFVVPLLGLLIYEFISLRRSS